METISALATTVSNTGSLLDGLKSWFVSQTNVAPTLHLAEFRSHMNARAMHPTDAGLPRGACTVGSRWMRYSFYSEDYGKQVTVTSSGAKFRYTVDGILVRQQAGRRGGAS